MNHLQPPVDTFTSRLDCMQPPKQIELRQRNIREAFYKCVGLKVYGGKDEDTKMIWTATDSEHTAIWLDYNREYREKVQELLNCVE